MTKADAKPISEEMYRSEIIQGDLTTDALEHMSRVALEVYLPLLTNEKVSFSKVAAACRPPPPFVSNALNNNPFFARRRTKTSGLKW